MKYENLWLSGSCIKKKTPVDYDFNGRRGTTYSIFLDSGENVYELKVSEEIYNSMTIGVKYVLNCSCNIDRNNKDSNNFIVHSVIKECGALDDFKLVLLSELDSVSTGKEPDQTAANPPQPEAGGKTASRTQPETKTTPKK